MSHNPVAKSWRELSEAASKEQDPRKLIDLVTELNAVLQEREEKLRNPEVQSSNP